MNLTPEQRQISREEEMLHRSRAINLQRIQGMIESGASSSALPLTARILGKFAPLGAKVLKDIIDDQEPTLRAGNLKSVFGFLTDLGHEEAVATAILACLDALGHHGQLHRTRVFQLVGKALRNEIYIQSYTQTDPDRAGILERRAQKESMGKDRKLRLYKESVDKTGIEAIVIAPEWGVQMAAPLVGILEGLELLTPVMGTENGHPTVFLTLSSEILEAIEKSVGDLVDRGNVEVAPLVCPPLDWAPDTPGGFHTPLMRDLHPLILHSSSKTARAVQASVGPRVYEALNALQKTQWRVSARVLGVVEALASKGLLAEVVPDVVQTIPEYPEHLKGIPAEQRTPEQKAEHKVWAGMAREAWAIKNKQTSATYRYVRIIEAARADKNEEVLYFTWQMDSRGRMYPATTGISPQGSDLQKALLEFKQGYPIDSPRALELFKVNLAHRWGYDKASYPDTVKWVDEMTPAILEMAGDPTVYTDWTSCDSPLLFIQAAMEYREYLQDPQGFRSHIPIAADGSCSGIQHLAAMSLDPVAGKAVNLTPTEKRQDIYMEVATKTHQALKESPELPSCLVPFLDFGIPRSLVKRPVMTFAYGVTKHSVPDYLYSDYLINQGPEMDPRDRWRAAWSLANPVWEAITSTVKKPMAVMKFLTTAIRSQKPGKVFRWMTPDGFPAAQRSVEYQDTRLTLYYRGSIRIKYGMESPKANLRKHAQAFPPNFVHSMDATHLRMTVNRMKEYGCTDFAMIHDDFGVPVCWAPTLWNVVREEFYRLYTDNNPLKDLQESLQNAPEPPTRGDLDLSGVLTSPFAFK